MSLYAYLWGIRLFLLLSLCAWVGIVVAVDPQQAGAVGLWLFFISLFGTILGLLILSVTALYQRSLGTASAAHHLGGAFRQAFLLSLFAIGMVFLRMENMLTWWDGLLCLAAILLLEFTYRKLATHRLR